MAVEKQNAAMITKDVSVKLKPTPSWKGAGFDKTHAFCSKFFTAINEVLASFEWMYRSGGCSRMVVLKKSPKKDI